MWKNFRGYLPYWERSFVYFHQQVFPYCTCLFAGGYNSINMTRTLPKLEDQCSFSCLFKKPYRRLWLLVSHSIFDLPVNLISSAFKIYINLDRFCLLCTASTLFQVTVDSHSHLNYCSSFLKGFPVFILDLPFYFWKTSQNSLLKMKVRACHPSAFNLQWPHHMW